jgi:nucleolar protein 4
MEAINATEHHGRTIAVDWSIPKVQYREVEAKEAAEANPTVSEDTEMKEASDNEDDETNSESDSESDKEEAADNDESEEESEDSDATENEDSDTDGEKEDVEAKKLNKKTGPTTADGTTLFIRNLLFESTEQDLKQL